MLFVPWLTVFADRSQFSAQYPEVHDNLSNPKRQQHQRAFGQKQGYNRGYPPHYAEQGASQDLSNIFALGMSSWVSFLQLKNDHLEQHPEDARVYSENLQRSRGALETMNLGSDLEQQAE